MLNSRHNAADREGSTRISGKRFQNTGQIETNAIFIGDLFVDGELVETIESAPRATPVGQTVDVEFSLDGIAEAEYRVVGRINFDGRETADREVGFRVGNEGSDAPVVPLGLAAGAVALIVLVGGGFAWRRRRAT